MDLMFLLLQIWNVEAIEIGVECRSFADCEAGVQLPLEDYEHA